MEESAELRNEIAQWLAELDHALGDGMHSEQAVLSRARAALEADVEPESEEDAEWLATQLSRIERDHGVRLRDADR